MHLVYSLRQHFLRLYQYECVIFIALNIWLFPNAKFCYLFLEYKQISERVFIRKVHKKIERTEDFPYL